MATQADDIARLTGILVADHVAGGKAARLRARAWPQNFFGPDRGSAPDGLGHLAKACGTAPETVAAWETGQAVPTTGQALSWLSELHRRQPVSVPGGSRTVQDMEGYVPPPKPEASVTDPQAVVLADGGKRRDFTPDLTGSDSRDVARFLSDTASRAGYSPRMPRTLGSPVVSFLALLARDGKVTHALSRDSASAVHAVLEAAHRRILDDGPHKPVAAGLLREWEKHVSWKAADDRRRLPARPGFDDDDEGGLTRGRR